MSDRLVTREAAKAETVLRNFNKQMLQAKVNYDAAQRAVSEARRKFVSELPQDVQAMLKAAGLILDVYAETLEANG